MYIVYYLEDCFLCYVHISIINIVTLYIYIGLPVPIVAIAAGIANKHYGSDNGLAHVLSSDTTDTCKQIICMVHGIN